MHALATSRRLAALLLATLVLLGGCLPGAQPAPPKVGESAPDIAFATLDGRALKLSEFRGQVVLLNFWATTCPPCRAEMPDLEAVYKEVKDRGGIVIGIDQRESPDTVQRFVDELKMTFPVTIDSTGAIFGRYGVQFIPTSFVVDKQGVVRFMKVGQMDRETIRRYFTTLQ
ncbi:MAG: TlpA family protein disulfide reductase [Chloroflexota bacterium]